MLKKVLLNSKTIPVPVPLKTLGDAIHWVETTLVPPGHTLTRIILNGRVVSGGMGDGSASVIDQRLDDRSRLEVQIDSPVDLAVQALDAIHNLASVITSGIKQTAVTLWQAKPVERPADVEALAGDLKLVIDLLDHLSGLVDPLHTDSAAVQGIATMLRRVDVSMQMARSNSDWKGCARILLNRIEPLLKDLVSEADTLQIRVLATRGQKPKAIAADAG